MVFNSGDFKNGISFSFRIPSDPPKGAPGGGLRPIHHKRSCDISILGLLAVGILNYIMLYVNYYYFWYEESEFAA